VPYALAPRRASLAVLALATVLALTVAGRNAARAWRATHPVREHVTADDRAKASSDLEGLQEATFRTSDGLTLRGWYAPGERRAVVIFVHGVDANRTQLLPEATAIHRHGYGVLVFDSRAMGESDGSVSTWGDLEQRDVTAALDYVSARPEVGADRVAIVGFSAGGSAAAFVAARDRRVRALVLCGTWSSLEAELKRAYARYGALSWGPALAAFRASGVDFDHVRPVDHVGEIAPRPILVIAGDREEGSPLSEMRRLFDAAGDPKELWVVPGAPHGGYLSTAPVAYEARVVGFLDRALSDARAAP
jgi:dipeptidyl aminopeptidase/acylaminoacyl peptidase